MSKNKKNIFKNPMKFSIFTGEKNLCVLHGQVFIMELECHITPVLIIMRIVANAQNEALFEPHHEKT